MKVKILLLLLSIFTFLSTPVSAQEKPYKNDYRVEYFLTEDNNQLNSKVKFTVTITNLNQTEFVDKVGISFPDTFKIHDVAAADQKGRINPEVTTKDGKINIMVTFNDPEIGQNSQNSFALEFNQDNLFRIFGNVWEVMMPTISNTSSYQVVVHLPENTTKKISIAKPKPDSIEGNKITWRNPESKTIYALFGDVQYYSLNLQYHLENPKIVPVYEDVAFPPDTLYQKVYADSIDPPPDEVRRDEDGNWLGRYYLKPKQKVDIEFKGSAELHVQPREETVSVIRSELKNQKSFLTAPSEFWNIAGDKEQSFSNPHDMYSFIAKTFSYNYKKLEGEVTRLGAEQALAHPELAVCTEFTDTFVSLARKKGIYAREIQGYGYTQDQRLRPLSLVTDVLHAWPEYYDTETELWKQVDPTWENTSGIDYFSSFDLNHIVFAIHGKKDEYPYPAGSYKLEDSKDVSVNAIATKPKDRILVALHNPSYSGTITDRNTGKFTFTIENKSNIYIWNTPISIKGTKVQPSVGELIVDVLPPYGKREYSFTYKSDGVSKKEDGILTMRMFDTELYTGSVTIVPYYYKIALVISAATLVVTIMYVLLKYAKKRMF